MDTAQDDTAPDAATESTAWRTGPRRDTVAKVKKQQARQQYESYRQERFELPPDTDSVHFEILRRTKRKGRLVKEFSRKRTTPPRRGSGADFTCSMVRV